MPFLWRERAASDQAKRTTFTLQAWKYCSWARRKEGRKSFGGWVRAMLAQDRQHSSVVSAPTREVEGYGYRESD